jgi:hybrid polyketide synthase/nonribosomal peptide synthetase ACE1
VSVTLTSSRTQSTIMSFIHPSTPARAIRDVIPKNTSVFVNLSGESQHENVRSRLETQLPAKCKVYGASNFFRRDSDISDDFSAQAASRALESCCSRAITEFPKCSIPGNMTIIELRAVPNFPAKDVSLKVVNWRATETVPAKVYPPEDYTQFKGDRTYLLVGLTGELGTSLCRWMITRGARYIALTSRNPKVSQKWLAAMKTLGATVKVFPM